MKCQYCGNNLGLEEEFCPHCGKVNSQAAQHVADMKNNKEDYDQTKENVIKKSTKFNARTARLAIIAVMVLVASVMLAITLNYADVEKRIDRKEQKIAENRERIDKEVEATLKEMEEHRDYLAMDYYVLNHRIKGDDKYFEYGRVFTAATTYEVIYSDILSIVSGYDYFGEKTKEDWCYDLGIYISQWNDYCAGEFWKDNPDSPMHAPEHQAFLDDAKKDTQDLVQVYFKLTDEQANAMWDMDEQSIGAMLYENCKDLYPEVTANE